MKELEKLRHATSLSDLAKLLGVSAKGLAYILYKSAEDGRYVEFCIPKKSGGERLVSAPNEKLKMVQRRLSSCLQDCIEDIQEEGFYPNKFSHGFTRNRSILSNAQGHVGRKYVINIDILKFFESINFGRVRGFFIKNRNFQLNPKVATIIAQICCYNNSLPQGAPSSPVVANLLLHPLDVRLARLAKKNSCYYSRYADDITFSTNDGRAVANLARISEAGASWEVGSALKNEILRHGFDVNLNKTRVQYRASRQEVTGITVNRKMAAERQYAHTTRAMCHSLFTNGEYHIKQELTDIDEGKKVEKGSIDTLHGRLAFIDSVARYNMRREWPSPDDMLGDGKERLYRKFIFYRYCYKAELPTFIFEGDTDYIYVKSAINRLASLPGSLKRNADNEMGVAFFGGSRTAKRFFGTSSGSDQLKKFIEEYPELCKQYADALSNNPVVVVLDNDEGAKGAISLINNKFKRNINRDGGFINLFYNLYVLLIPKVDEVDTCIEDYFDARTRAVKIGGRRFSKDNNYDHGKFYGKRDFAMKVVKAREKEIDFSGFEILMQFFDSIIREYKAIRA